MMIVVSADQRNLKIFKLLLFRCNDNESTKVSSCKINNRS